LPAKCANPVKASAANTSWSVLRRFRLVCVIRLNLYTMLLSASPSPVQVTTIFHWKRCMYTDLADL